MTTVDFDAFAEMRVAIERGESRDAVIARAGLSVPQWIAVQRRWLRAFALEAAQGRRDLARRYASRLEHAATSERSQAPREPAPPPMMPSAHRPAMAVPSADRSEPMASAAGGRSRATGAMPAHVPAATTTPFKADPNATPPPSAAAELEAEAASLAGETAFVMAITDAELGLAAPNDDLDATAEISNLDLGDLDVLPFEAAQVAMAPASGMDDVQREAAALAGETAFVAALTDEELGAALPFETGRERPSPHEPQPSPVATPSPAIPELTVQQYASLLAELHRESQRRAAGAGSLDLDRGAILARYHLDQARFERVEMVWSERFREQPASYGAFRSAYDEYSQWLNAKSH